MCPAPSITTIVRERPQQSYLDGKECRWYLVACVGLEVEKPGARAVEGGWELEWREGTSSFTVRIFSCLFHVVIRVVNNGAVSE